MVAYGVWQLLAGHFLRIGRRGFLAAVAWLFALVSIVLQAVGGQALGLMGAAAALSVAYLVATGVIVVAFGRVSGRGARELLPATADLAYLRRPDAPRAGHTGLSRYALGAAGDEFPAGHRRHGDVAVPDQPPPGRAAAGAGPDARRGGRPARASRWGCPSCSASAYRPLWLAHPSLHYLARFWLPAVRGIKRWRPRVIQAGHVYLAPLARLLARRLRLSVRRVRVRPGGVARWAPHGPRSDWTPTCAARRCATPTACCRPATSRARLLDDWGVPSERIVCVPYGASPRPILEPPSGTTLLSVGRLVPRKGIDTVIRALSHLDAAVEYRVVGRGPDEARLRHLAVAEGVAERVHFLGRLDDADAGGRVPTLRRLRAAEPAHRRRPAGGLRAGVLRSRRVGPAGHRRPIRWGSRRRGGRPYGADRRRPVSRHGGGRHSLVARGSRSPADARAPPAGGGSRPATTGPTPPPWSIAACGGWCDLAARGASGRWPRRGTGVASEAAGRARSRPVSGRGAVHRGGRAADVRGRGRASRRSSSRRAAPSSIRPTRDSRRVAWPASSARFRAPFRRREACFANAGLSCCI